MSRLMHSILFVLFSLGLIPATMAGDRLSVSKILEHPSDYQAKVVIVEGNATGITDIPTRRDAHRCAGGAVYDGQSFTLQDESGAIQIGVAGTCRPNATKPVLENEHIRIRGVVVADEKDPKGIPMIYADAIDRVTP